MQVSCELGRSHINGVRKNALAGVSDESQLVDRMAAT
jgi:hypothetical protein